MENKIVGTDISKKKFDVALLLGSKVKSKAFPNTIEGFVAFINWLLLHQEANRLATAEDVVRPSIEAVILLLKEEIKKTRRLIRESVDKDPDLRGKRDLLESIPGIGEVTSAIILAEFGGAERFGEARRMVSFCGLAPKHHQSGTSVRGKSRMSKAGSSRIRRALYMPALVAMKHNPVMIEFCERLRGYGKPKMVIVGAVMRKLTHIIFGVLKGGKPFDPTYATKIC